MSCNKIIHNEFKNMGQLVCDFCNVKLVDDMIVKLEDPCCEKMHLVTDDGMYICVKCGVGRGYNAAPEYTEEKKECVYKKVSYCKHGK